MVQLPKPKRVEVEGDYYHVRFRNPSDFSSIRTPDWSIGVADEVETGSKVRMGKRKTTDEWVVQSVLVPSEVGKAKARSAAEAILKKIES